MNTLNELSLNQIASSIKIPYEDRMFEQTNLGMHKLSEYYSKTEGYLAQDRADQPLKFIFQYNMTAGDYYNGFHYDAVNRITIIDRFGEIHQDQVYFPHCITGSFTFIDDQFLGITDMQERSRFLILKSYSGLEAGDLCIAQLQARFPEGLQDKNFFAKIHCWDLLLDVLFERASELGVARVLIPKPENIFWDKASKDGLNSR